LDPERVIELRAKTVSYLITVLLVTNTCEVSCPEARRSGLGPDGTEKQLTRESRDWVLEEPRAPGIRILRLRDSLLGSRGIQEGTKVYISRMFSLVDRSFVLNSNSISYILVTAQYFRTSLGDIHWTYLGSLPKTPQTPNVLKLASITTDCERYITLLNNSERTDHYR
jgi:hypothetical protein